MFMAYKKKIRSLPVFHVFNKRVSKIPEKNVFHLKKNLNAKLHNRVVLPTLHFTCWFHDNHRKARLGSSIEYITDDPIPSKQTQ